MKDKEKQIEEMAKKIRLILENRTDIGFIPDLDKPIAEELLKDSVVLSKEELEEKYEPSEKFMSVVRELEDLKQNLEDKVVISKEEYDKLKYTFNCGYPVYKQGLEEGSKETAENIINPLLDVDVIDEDYKQFFLDICEKLEQLADKYDVEIEE